MSHRAAVHDLKGLILSFHSLIAIETVEEERVRALIGEVAADQLVARLGAAQVSGSPLGGRRERPGPSASLRKGD